MNFLKPSELRRTLKISRSTESRFLKRGMPHINSGKLRRYNEMLVVEWFAQYSQETTPAITLLDPGHYRCKQCNFLGTVHVSSPAGPCPQCGTRQPLTFLGALA